MLPNCSGTVGIHQGYASRAPAPGRFRSRLYEKGEAGLLAAAALEGRKAGLSAAEGEGIREAGLQADAAVEGRKAVLDTADGEGIRRAGLSRAVDALRVKRQSTKRQLLLRGHQ